MENKLLFIGGFGFSTALTIPFFSLRNPYGIAGDLIVLVAHE